MTSGKSFISVDIDATDATNIYVTLAKTFSAEKRKQYNAIGAKAAQAEIQSYYAKLGRNLWVNPALSTHGPGRQKTRFAENVTTGWAVSSVTGSGATIQNKAVGLAHKVTGGTITAKRTKFLTIPLIPQAHGRRARDFAVNIGPLFAAKGCLIWKKSDGTITPAYALKKSVTHAPWKGALPPDATISDAFGSAALDAIGNELS